MEPGRRETARVSAWLPGRRAGKERGTCHPWDSRIREADGPDSGTSGNVRGVDGLISERGSSLRTPVVLPEEVSPSGSRRTDPFPCRAHSLTQAGTGRYGVLVSLCQPVAFLPGYLGKVGFPPSPFVGHPVNIFGPPTLAS